MAGGFDTQVDGSPASVRTMGGWLRDTLRVAVEQATDEAARARNEGAAGFHGEAGQAYQAYTTTVVTFMADHGPTISRAADCFDDYAVRLQLCEDRMGALRSAARESGLTVTGTVVHAPGPAPEVDALPAGATQAQQDTHDRAVADHDDAVLRIQAYDQLLADAEWEVESFTTWIDTHLTAQASSFLTPDVSKLLESLKDNAGSLGLAAALEASKKRNQSLQERLAEKYKDRRSGDPRRSSGARDPEARARIRRLLREAGLLRKGLKILGPASVLYDTYQGLEEDKPAGGVVAVLAGAGATAAVIALAPVGAPAAGVVIVAVGVGYGVSEGTQAVWGALPDSFTDPADEFVGDTWDDVKGGAVKGAEVWLDITGFR